MPQIRYIDMQQRPRSLFMQIVGAIVGVGVFIVSLLLGAVLIAAFFGFVLIAGAFVYGRLWWLRRKMARTGEGDGEFIETEYQVVNERRRDEP